MNGNHNNINSNDLSHLRQTAAAAARVGGGILLEWRGRFSVREKNHHDLVTDADFAAQEAIVETLLTKYPDHQILGEESTSHDLPAPDVCCWVIDPLDGTTNYVHGFPAWCVSIGVALGGEILAGAVYDPLKDELFTAAAGQGARLGDEPLAVSGCRRIDQALVSTSLPNTVAAGSPDLRTMLELSVQAQAMRRLGSAALNLAYLASGRIDAFSAAETHPWDVAAGLLLVREAGGVVTGIGGQPFELFDPHFCAAATRDLHGEMVAVLTNATDPSG